MNAFYSDISKDLFQWWICEKTVLIIVSAAISSADIRSLSVDDEEEEIKKIHLNPQRAPLLSRYTVRL